MRCRNKCILPRLIRLEDRLAPATQLLPDLQVLPSYLSGWYLDTTSSPGTTLLRYATAVGNGGDGAFELNGTTTTQYNADGTQSQLVNQKITWSDGHDSGIYTLEHLRGSCQCAECQAK